MFSLSCWCSLFTPLSLSLSLSHSFPFPLLLLPLLLFLPPLPGASNTSFAIRPLLEYLNSFDHYDILAYKPIRSHLDVVALQNDVNIIVSWIEPTSIPRKQSSWCSLEDYTLCSPKSLWHAVTLLKPPP